MVLGFLSGAYICNRVLGDIFVKCCTKLMEIPVIIIKFLIKWLLFPVKRCKLLWYKAYECAKKEIINKDVNIIETEKYIEVNVTYEVIENIGIQEREEILWKKEV